MKKRYYYNFWIYTSGQSHASTVKCYDVKPCEDDLRRDLQNWCETQSFYGVAESWTSGFDKLRNVPKNRTDCLDRWTVICDKKSKVLKEWNIVKSLLNLPHFR